MLSTLLVHCLVVAQFANMFHGRHSRQVPLFQAAAHSPRATTVLRVWGRPSWCGQFLTFTGRALQNFAWGLLLWPHWPLVVIAWNSASVLNIGVNAATACPNQTFAHFRGLRTCYQHRKYVCTEDGKSMTKLLWGNRQGDKTLWEGECYDTVSSSTRTAMIACAYIAFFFTLFTPWNLKQ